MRKIFIIGFIGLMGILGLRAQEMTVQAPKQVYLGDNFKVNFVINDNARDFQGPTFKGFSLRSGPNRGTQQSVTMYNGQITNSIQM